MCRNAKRKHFKYKCKEAKGDGSKTWKVINEATNKKRKSNTYPDFIETRNADGDAKKVKCKTEIANEMNRQFTQMGSKLAKKLDPTNVKFTDYLESPSNTSFYLRKTTDSEVEKLFLETDINKGVGIDETHPKVAKWGVTVFVPIVTKLFNKCCEEGVYPDSLKSQGSYLFLRGETKIL